MYRSLWFPHMEVQIDKCNLLNRLKKWIKYFFGWSRLQPKNKTTTSLMHVHWRKSLIHFWFLIVIKNFCNIIDIKQTVFCHICLQCIHRADFNFYQILKEKKSLIKSFYFILTSKFFLLFFLANLSLFYYKKFILFICGRCVKNIVC